jgi:4-aminobutyrate aminotransferase/(S)-3-amino-2-methylpropionate transaminase
MGRSDELVRRREEVVCRGVGRLSTMTAAEARGAIIVDADGREFIDFAGGIGVLNVGHSDSEVVRAIQEQAAALQHTCIHVATYEPYVALCEKLVELFPHGGRAKAMLVSTGAEAVENAIKIARQATGRTGVICFTGAFHGRTTLCATLTSKVDYKKGCGAFMPDVYRLPFPRRAPTDAELSEGEIVERELARLRSAFRDTIAPADVATIIIELIQGEGGFNVAPKAYIRGLREMCDEHEIVLIFDEVQTAFARTGRWAASEHHGVVPDLSTLAKSMGGGMPIAAVVGKAEVMDRVSPGTLGGTYGGNPVACAAALATISQIERLGLNERAIEVGDAIRSRFDALRARVPAITDVRGLGAMVAMELHADADLDRPATALVREIIDGCRGRGLLLIAAGLESNVIRVLCPLVITDEQLERGLSILEEETLRRAGAGVAGAAGRH